ncbi:ubiquitin carrier protein [Dunaliella salina]|uniref:Ubiquitin carrier protein n=1 Tax=Dunaliella salina TaxID=3046 RepID=A0ABQ7H7K1_DUNSA|nr:ubiquitin carrier protein [Dunaliella salina]|eukprot:KAF5842837.1 ubiquitin carrier protein [Dunaliella salina]
MLSANTQKTLMRELKALQDQPPEGIRVVFNEQNLADVQAELDGPAGTPYEGGLFRIRLSVGADYPTSPPKGFFATKIFHPNVSPSGEICVNVLKKDWTPETGLKHVLVVVRCLLIEPNPDSALNEEAGRQLQVRMLVVWQEWSTEGPVKVELPINPVCIVFSGASMSWFRRFSLSGGFNVWKGSFLRKHHAGTESAFKTSWVSVWVLFENFNGG